MNILVVEDGAIRLDALDRPAFLYRRQNASQALPPAGNVSV